MQSTDGLWVFNCFSCFIDVAVVDLGSASKAFFKDVTECHWLMASITKPVKKALNLVNISLAI